MSNSSLQLPNFRLMKSKFWTLEFNKCFHKIFVIELFFVLGNKINLKKCYGRKMKIERKFTIIYDEEEI